MPRLSHKVPAYRLHKASGNAVVTINCRDHYLGLHSTAVSRANYDRLIAEWLARGRAAPQPCLDETLSVASLVNAFRKGAAIPSSHADSFRAVMSLLVRLYGRTPVHAFGPLALKAVRTQMFAQGWNRRTINDRVHIARRIFRWGVESEMVRPEIVHALEAVSGLRAGQSTAPEPKQVQPVAVERVETCLPYLPEVVADMVRVQLLTGMRTGELVILRPADLDMSGATWVYRPIQHKTKHRGMSREIAIGPQAQAILQRYLLADQDAFCFSPADSERRRRAIASGKRKTPLSCGNRPGTNAGKRRCLAER